jgi:predicted O-linked N-acetylglucosamine transferase (SPINDLY family)
MREVPNSRLLLKYRQYSNTKVQEDLTAQFGRHGISRDRVDFEGRSPREELLSSYGYVDIALDPIPFGGGTTTAEALWMGVPVVTTRGDRWVGRVSESILESIGLGELVAKNGDEFVTIARALSQDVGKLCDLHSSLRCKMLASHFCDGAGFAANLEDAYREMWRKACKKYRMGV